MTPNTPYTSFDFSAFALNRNDVEEIHRTAEIARSVYLAKAVGDFFRRIGDAYRSTSDLFGYAQRMNQAARL